MASLSPVWRRLCRALICVFAAVAFHASGRAADRNEIDLSGSGWRLWLDRDAKWKDDTLYFPAPALETLPVNPPTGGWRVLDAAATGIAASVPGTVEEYLQTKPGPEGDITGVSWWWRTITLPQATSPKTILLRFEAIRQRAEIFINRRLAGYDVVGNSPLEIDITRFAKPGERCEIAVRVTDPAGNFDWRDSQPMHWGNYALPMSHGFGGLTGRARLIVCDRVHIEDIYVQNTPDITTANALLEIDNNTGEEVRRDVAVRVTERRDPSRVVFETVQRDVALKSGSNRVTVKITAPNAEPWDLNHPVLYLCEASLREADAITDSERRVFGFRWFSPDGIGQNAMLRLNGRRIVLRTAISWGFWPINGIYPTEALAEKQVHVAKELGLNMLNFHRAIGNPIVLEKADELGLLYFEEPGAYKSVESDSFGQKLAREKLLRMVRRDRSHPSLIIYNLINEWDSRNPHPNPAEIGRHRDDMAAAHELDPSRLILHTSAWARGKEIDDPAKLHFRPFDPKPYLSGWYDVHHAGGPATWNEGLYRSPTDYYGLTDDVKEVVFWGEEGALSTPPRLALIKAELDRQPHLGWDGALYLEWYAAFESFLDRKGLRSAFRTVDAFTSAMGAVSLGHQGRRIENVRLSNITDGYAINGWESEIIENHSGIVDCFRNPKSDPAILAYYNQPLYVAVKARTTVLSPSGHAVVDFFLINETGLHGPHQLAITLRDAAGNVLITTTQPVTVTGGDVFGEPLATGVELPVSSTARGLLRVKAALLDLSGTARAQGHDEILVVDWKTDAVRGQGAVWESEDRIRRFLDHEKQVAVPVFGKTLPRLDWVVVARAPNEAEPARIPAAQFSQPNGSAGLHTTFFNDRTFAHAVHERVDPAISYSVDDGAAPDPALAVMTNYGVRWDGRLQAPRDGRYGFVVRTTGGVRLRIDGRTVIDAPPSRAAQTVRGEAMLQTGKPVDLTLEFRQGRGGAQCELSWITPEEDPTLASALLKRVSEDGTTLVILERADTWMPLVTGAADPSVRYTRSFKVGKTWLGGVHFVRDHPLFAGLPVNTAMDWPYQALVRNGDDRTGLQLEGEELVAGCYHSYPMQLGTAVGVIPYGRGRIVFSTLDICSNLNSPDGPADVARKLLGNFLNYATAPSH